MTLKNRISPEKRRKKLKELLIRKNPLRFLEAHDGISAIISNNTKITINNGEVLEFDGLWESSFTDSASKGYPDADIISFDSRCESLKYILDATNKPIIFDGDTGGDPTNFEYQVKRLEDLGVSMIIIEDKVYPKRNSLDETASQIQEDPQIFAIKLKRGKEALHSDGLMIAARIESLITGSGLKDALLRAKIYLNAGADAIMIHSKEEDPKEIFEFAKEYNELSKNISFRKPLICVPTTYNTVTVDEFEKAGFNIIIYANHLIRASFKAMKKAAELILRNGRSFEVESICTPVKKIFSVVGFEEIKKKDKKFQKAQRVIIPAAGFDNNFDIPKAMIKIKGKPIIKRQIEVLKKFGFAKITVIRGWKKELVTLEGIKYFDNDFYDKTYIAHSLFHAEEDFKNGFLYINSDILFTEEVINKIINTPYDIVLAVDRTYQYHKHEIDKKLDMVLTKNKPTNRIWKLGREENEVIRIGKNIKIEMADYEYIGIANFSENGAEILRKVYHDCKMNWQGKFHEADDFSKADFMDLIQEIINRGFKVNIVEIHQGWIEINDERDVKLAEMMI